MRTQIHLLGLTSVIAIAVSTLAITDPNESNQARDAMEQIAKLAEADSALLLEAFAAGVAHTPCLRSVFPRSDDVIKTLGTEVGSTLGSSEYTSVLYAAVAALIALPEADREVCLRELRAKSARFRALGD